MLLKKVLVPAIVMLGIASGAFAQERRNEVQIFGQFSKQTDPSGQPNFYLATGSYGRYITPRFLFQGTASVITTGDIKIVTFGPGLKYYLRDGRQGSFVPFVGGDFGLTYQSLPGSDFGFGTTFHANLGASYFMTEATSLDLTAQYEKQKITVEIATPFGTFESTSSTTSTKLLVSLTTRF